MPNTAKPPIDRHRVLENLISQIGPPNAPAVNVLLTGPWGAGKTTLLRELSEKLPKKDDFVILQFSPWESMASESPSIAFRRYLQKELEKITPATPEDTAKWKATKKAFHDCLPEWGEKVARAGAKALAAPYGLSEVADILLPPKLISELIKIWTGDGAPPKTPGTELMAARDAINALLTAFLKLSNPAKSRLLIILDDMDRCRPEEAIALLDGMYQFLLPQEQILATREMPEDPGSATAKDYYGYFPPAFDHLSPKWPVSCVWALNIGVLEEFLAREYVGVPSFEPRSYLEKIFHRRVNLPPVADVGEARLIWQHQLATMREPEKWTPLAARLAKSLDYATMGNLRLYHHVAEACVRRWYREGVDPASLTTDRLARDARLVLLLHAYARFRENVILFPALWPEFVNRLNARRTSHAPGQTLNHPPEPLQPSFRDGTDQSLVDLLKDLGALEYDEPSGRYQSVADGQERLKRELLDLMQSGY